MPAIILLLIVDAVVQIIAIARLCLRNARIFYLFRGRLALFIHPIPAVFLINRANRRAKFQNFPQEIIRRLVWNSSGFSLHSAICYILGKLAQSFAVSAHHRVNTFRLHESLHIHVPHGQRAAWREENLIIGIVGREIEDLAIQLLTRKVKVDLKLLGFFPLGECNRL